MSQNKIKCDWEKPFFRPGLMYCPYWDKTCVYLAIQYEYDDLTRKCIKFLHLNTKVMFSDLLEGGDLKKEHYICINNNEEGKNETRK